jgi:hypothetical protein
MQSKAQHWQQQLLQAVSTLLQEAPGWTRLQEGPHSCPWQQQQLLVQQLLVQQLLVQQLPLLGLAAACGMQQCGACLLSTFRLLDACSLCRSSGQ